jgi:hypothetical protein
VRPFLTGADCTQAIGLRVQQIVEGNLENLFYFARARSQSERRIDQPNHRVDTKTTASEILTESTDHPHVGRLEGDLLLGFPQSSSLCIGVFRVPPPTRKTDVSGMRDLLVPAGEQYSEPRLAHHDRDENGGRNRPSASGNVYTRFAMWVAQWKLCDRSITAKVALQRTYAAAKSPVSKV